MSNSSSMRKKRTPSEASTSGAESMLLTSPRKIAALSLDEPRSSLLTDSPVRAASSPESRLDSDDLGAPVLRSSSSVMAMSVASATSVTHVGVVTDEHGFKVPTIQSLATPMALPDDHFHDDDDDEEDEDEEDDEDELEEDDHNNFTPSSSPAQRFRRRPPPPGGSSQPWHQRRAMRDRSGDASAPTSSPIPVHSAIVANSSTSGGGGGGGGAAVAPARPRACPPTPSPVRVVAEFRRPRANQLGGRDDDVVVDPAVAEANALADRQAYEQLCAAGLGHHGGASARLFAATASDRRPPPSPRFRQPRSPAPVRRRAMSQAQPVLNNPFSPDRRRAHTHDAAQISAAVGGSGDNASQTASSAEPTSRYQADFTEQGMLGQGVSSVVYKALNNTDGWVYAIKVKQGGAHGISKQALNEMFALAALGSHVNVIRYYNAWIEDSRLYLQCEFCSGGSVEQRVAAGAVFSEAELCVLFRQMAGALAHIHAHELVHLDVKPENMFIAAGGPPPVVDAGASMYKLGDLGLISAASDVSSFEDGDSRYLPTELLNADASSSAVDLSRADVFSLGASIYELARRRPLPARDAEWHEIRRADIARPEHLSHGLFDLLLACMSATVARRPSAAELLKHPLLLTDGEKDVIQMRTRIRQLEQMLCEAERLA